MTAPAQKSPGLIKKLLTPFGGSAAHAEKARMEAFLAAIPSAYCGFATDGTLAHSPAFCRVLGIDEIKAIHDIAIALDTADAAILEGLFTRLQQDGTGFSITAQSADRRKVFQISGTQGTDSNGQDTLHILWLDDVTAPAQTQKKLSEDNAALSEEKQRLQTTLDNIMIPAWLRDNKGQLLWCNRAYAQELDQTPEEIIAAQNEWPFKPAPKAAQTGLCKCTKSTEKLAGAALAEAAQKAGETVYNCTYVVLSGKRRLFRISETPLPALPLTLGTAHDISHEEELESAHRRDKTAYQGLMEQLGTAVALYNADERLEFYNTAFARLWDLEDPYLNSRPKLGDIMEKLREMRRLPEQADFRLFKQEWLAMFTRLIDPHEDMLYLPDGTALRMLAVPHPMGGLMMIFEDVTSRLELESSYNTLIAVQQETLDNLAEGVAAFGSDGRLRLWNPAFARLWQLTPEMMEGQPHVTRLVERFKDLFAADDWSLSQDKLIKQALERKSRESHMFLKNGTTIAYATVPLPDGGVLVTHIDVTDTLRVEKALRDKNAALEAAEQLKTDFLANVSYQLRTPLSTLMGFTEILEKEYFGALNEKQKEYTTGMHEAGNTLLQLINDILDLSTIEAGYMVLEKQDVPIYTLLNSLKGITAEWARKSKIEIKLSCPKNIGQASLDERRVKQVLLNLIRNAITYTPAGGIITLSAEKDKENNLLVLKVSDTGRGIPPEDQKRILKPFERIATGEPNDNKNGAGLGLTLVKNIVELHKGKLSLTSTPNKGTTIIIRLPLE